MPFDGDNPLLEQAASIGEHAGTGRDTHADDNEFGEASNANGSFERFMGSFGSPAKWAGH